MKTIFGSAINLLLILVMTACATSTQVIGTWKKEDKVYAYNKIAIFGIAHDVVTRKIFETSLEERMLANGYPAEAALDFLPPNTTEDNISPELVNAIFSSAKVDAVMTIHLLSVEDSRRFVVDGFAYQPYYYTYTFHDHYTEVHEYVYVSGYYTGELDVFLEANLFDLETGQLIWAAQTETIDLANVADIASSFSDVLVNDLAGSGVLVANPVK